MCLKEILCCKGLFCLLSVKGALVLQRLVLCEMEDDGKPGQMITRDAFEGFTTDELRYTDKNFTYQGTLNVTAQVLKIHLELSMWRHKHLYLPTCLKTLKGYTETRKNQINKKGKKAENIVNLKYTFYFAIKYMF